MTPRCVLTIAGSDSGGGAGIQADLATFATFGVHGATAVTALTAQNTIGVQGVYAVPAAFVDLQLQSVLTDFTVAAAKTGMLATAAIVELVARRGAAGKLVNLVVDPVMVATSGDRLLDPDAERAYLESLFPHALVVTPNVPEAEALVGRPLVTIGDLMDAARELHSYGPRYVVVKGGHLDGEESIDVVFDGSSIELLHARRVASRNTHGTGCTFSAAVAARLALGDRPDEAIAVAKRYVTDAIASAAVWRLGHGHGPVDHFQAGNTPVRAPRIPTSPALPTDPPADLPIDLPTGDRP